jgi:hypothetical protein
VVNRLTPRFGEAGEVGDLASVAVGGFSSRQWSPARMHSRAIS